MSENKQLKKPAATEADGVIAPCQKGIRVYPTRFALTDKAFENIKSKGEMPPLPKNASGDENYDVRRLRDGYVYILAMNAEVDKVFKISASAANGQAWYIYHYDPEDMDLGDTVWAGSFALIEDYNPEVKNYTSTIIQPYIELNEAIESAYFMFSDIRLPISLLREIETKDPVKDNWMKNIQLKNPQDYAIDIATVQQTVKDFSPQTKMMTDQELTSNAYRFTPIGKPKEAENVVNQLTQCPKGVIVTLDDPVGTARDLSGYHLYLTTERDSVLAKYEYAISTARILDAHALHKYKEEVKNAQKRWEYVNEEMRTSGVGSVTIEPPLIKFSQQYQKVFSDYIDSEHLKTNGDSDVLNALKAELQLEDELPGVNAINKMAYIPTRFGLSFKHLVSAHSNFICAHRDKLAKLYSLYTSNPLDGTAAKAWCCYMHGFLHGLDISPYGRNALIAALPIEDADAYKAPPYAQQATSAVESLKKFFADFTKALGALEKVAKTGYLNIATYDLVIELVIDKIYIRYANSSHKSYVGESFNEPKIIRSTYQAKLSTKEIEKILPTHLSQAPLPKHIKALRENISSLKVEKAPRQYDLFQITERWAGLNKALSASVGLGFFVQNKAETELGKLGNDPFLASMQVIAGMYAPKGGLEQHTSQALTELEQLTSRKNLQQSKWISYFEQKGAGSTLTRIRNAIINVNTGLAGIGAMFEYFNWVEADYKSDEVGKTAALLSMGGGLAIEGAIGSLGMLAGSSLSAGTLTLLTGLSYATLGIGIVLITIAIIYNYFAPEDIELWAENGFWGKSPKYWGEPDQEKAYEWKSPRSGSFVKLFEDSQFRYIEGKLELTNEVRYYRIEMQRYLKSVAEVVVTLDSANPRKILVNYPGIYTERDAQEIKIKTMVGYKDNKGSLYYQSNDDRFELLLNKLDVIKKLETEGVASLTILNEKLPYLYTINGNHAMGIGEVSYDELSSIELSVSIPNYQGNKYYKTSKQTKLRLKNSKKE